MAIKEEGRTISAKLVFIVVAVILAATVLAVSYMPHYPTIKASKLLLHVSSQSSTRLSIQDDRSQEMSNQHSHLQQVDQEYRTVDLNLKEELSKDMQRCSLALGMSQDTVNQSLDKINRIAEKAAFFLDTFWEVVPKPQDFLPDYKNPCFYANVSINKTLSQYFRSKLPAYKHHSTIPKADISWLYRELYEKDRANKTLHCLPYVLLPGILKSGTTTLHSALIHHHQIAKAERKEPQWWYRLPLNRNKKYLKVFIARYLTTFLGPSTRISSSRDGKSLITYDGSQSMMINIYDSSFHINHEDYCALPAVISRVLPNAKIIVLMRDPVPRAFSHYLQMHGRRNLHKWPKAMKENVSLHFDKNIRKSLSAFKECIAGSLSLYECVNQVRTNFRELKMWLGTGIYHIHIQKWMQFWPEDNFLLLKMEDMVANFTATLTRITDFISLDPVSDNEARMWFQKKNTQKYSTMFAETKQLLESFFEPYNQRLEELYSMNWPYH